MLCSGVCVVGRGQRCRSCAEHQGGGEQKGARMLDMVRVKKKKEQEAWHSEKEEGE